jgi:hypothetical protein
VVKPSSPEKLVAQGRGSCHSANPEEMARFASRGNMKKAKKAKAKKGRKVTNFKTDKRRKHRHFIVTVFYRDGERFARVYTDRGKASRFADRQKKSPVVKSARVTQLS